MSFKISGLPLAEFKPLFALSNAELEALHMVRRIADRSGFPCRVSLQDAEVGECLLLLNYEHLSVASPYRSRHAIFVRENAIEARPAANVVPELFRTRLLSVRAFDDKGMMTAADVVEGREVEPLIDRMLVDQNVAYLHVHYAKPGCFAARVDRC